MSTPLTGTPITFLLVGAYLLWSPLSYVKRLRAVSGSYQRYWWNSFERVIRWPAAALVIWPTLAMSIWPPTLRWIWWLTISFGVVTLIAYSISWRQMRANDRDDDDDWFKKTRRRLSHWWSARATPATEHR